MAAPERATHFTPAAAAPAASSGLQGYRSELAKLMMLHREAGETAHLANLLGRAPYAAAIIAGGAAATAVLSLSAMPAAQIIVWSLLVLCGAGFVARAYGDAIKAPFERARLAAFAEDFKAVLTYAGFAWGAGAFLVLPAATPALAALLFLTAPALALAALLRGHPGALLFAVPAAMLGSAGILLRATPHCTIAATAALLAAVALAGTTAWIQRREALAFAHMMPLPL